MPINNFSPQNVNAYNLSLTIENNPSEVFLKIDVPNK